MRSPPADLVHGDPTPETFGELTKRRCAIEDTEARRQDCYDRAILQRAFENDRDEFARQQRAVR